MKNKLQLCIKLLLGIVIWPSIVFAQTSTKNYIVTSVVQTAGVTSSTAVDALPYSSSTGKIKTITYFDGLGRQVLEVQCQASPSNLDLKTPVYYDNLGRQSKQYLPYINTKSDGSYDSDPYFSEGSFYSTGTTVAQDDEAWGYTQYDNSPLNRVTKQFGPGFKWHESLTRAGYPVTYDYITNEDDEVIEWTINGDSVEIGGFYEGGSLFGTKVTDEDGSATTDINDHSSIEYKDKLGRVILKKVYDGTQWLETYYVYDDFNLLRFVIPPLALNSLIEINGGLFNNLNFITIESGTTTISAYDGHSYILKGTASLSIVPGANGFSFDATTANGGSFVVKPYSTNICEDPLYELGYRYKYDERHRMVEKKLPGAAPVYMVYDNNDRLVATQDGNMRKGTATLSDDEWLITLYDALNRPVMTLKKIIAVSQTGLQTTFNGYTLVNGKINTAYSAGNALHNYRNSGIVYDKSLVNTDALTVTYYDSYYGLDAMYSGEFVADGLFSSDYKNIPTTFTSQTKGLTTITKVKNLETGNFLTTVNYYDEKGQIIRTVSDNHLNGKDVAINKYDFTGRVLVTIHGQYLSSTSSIIEGERFTYDQAGRLLKTYHCIENASTGEVELSSNTYNDIGQLKTKSIGNGVQTLDYKYNIRGWLKRINDPVNIGTDLFAEELFYENLSPGSGRDLHSLSNFTPCYNGNIAAMTFTDNYKNVLAGYGFNYDNMNRLTNAQYILSSGAVWSINSKFRTSAISYDPNGNIKTLQRTGSTAGTLIDNLSYTYLNNGNRLLRVGDAATATGGFTDGNTSGDDYAYDANGNANKDLNKGITVVQYNYLNMPRLVSKGTSQSVSYQYTAAGVKLKESYNNGTSTVVTDYINNFVYKDNVLSYILTGEGRINVNMASNTFKYEYWMKDLLGNTRVTFCDADGNGTIAASEIGQVTDYYPFGMPHENSDNKLDAAQKYLYNGKEKQDMTDWLDYGARMYDPQLGRWHTLDILAERSLSYSPYVYVKNNPLMFIDPTGLKDTTYNANTDKPVSPQPGTETPIYKRDANGNIEYDADGNAIIVPNPDAYNCFSYAFDNSQGDPKNNPVSVSLGIPKWDNDATDNVENYQQLSSNDPNKPGDRVIYYTDANGNGKYDNGENISHAAIVNTVDKNGNTTTVIGKMGEGPMSINHPRAPGYYPGSNGNTLPRAYLRSSSSSNSQTIQSSNNTFTPKYNIIAVRNATYMAPPVIVPLRRR